MDEPWLTEKQAAAVMAMAAGGMRVHRAADSLGINYSTFWNRLEGIKKRTKLDPRNFHDLVELEHIAMEVLHGKREQKEEQAVERAGIDSRDGADIPPSEQDGRRRGVQVSRSGRGQDGPERPDPHGGISQGLWQEGRLKRLGTGLRAKIRVTKDVQQLFDECRPPVGAVFEASVYAPNETRQRTVPFCAVEYGGKLVILRCGEYELIKEEDEI